MVKERLGEISNTMKGIFGDFKNSERTNISQRYIWKTIYSQFFFVGW